MTRHPIGEPLADRDSVLSRFAESGVEPPRVRLDRLEGEADLPMVPIRPDGPRYEILGEIGRGGMGVVFRGLDVDLGRDIAVKVLREEHARSPEITRRFIDEAKIEGRLQHPGIVPVYDLGLQADRRPYFTMKLVRGETFATLLGNRADVSADRRRILGIFLRVCQAIAYAHRQGVVHRDLKPSNILVGEFGEVQVVDWGFAKVLARDERPGEGSASDGVRIGRSVAGDIMGTPAYMAPEQAQGRVGDVDERADVFSLGAVLTEILTGEPPYGRANGDVLEQAKAGAVESARRRLRQSDADGDLVALAKRCLSPEREDRPRDAAEPAEVLGAHLVSVTERAHRAELSALAEAEAGARARARAEAARSAAGEQRRRRRRTVRLAGAVLLVILAAGAGRWAVEEGRRDRSLRATLGVEDVLRDVDRLRGERDFAAALAAARRVRVLAVAEGVSPEVRRQAAALVPVIERERDEHERAEVRRGENAVAAAKLTELRLVPPADPEVRHEAFAEVFGSLGIDLAALTPEDAAARVLARGVEGELLGALDSWGSPEARLVAELVAPEVPACRAVREAQRLLVSEEPERARELLEPAWADSPGDFWTNVLSAVAAERLPEPDLTAARIFWSAAHALRSSSAGVAERLARACLASGDARAAGGLWRLRGEDLLDQGDVDAALVLLLRAEEAYGEAEEPRLWCLLARARALRGEDEQARDRLERVGAWKAAREVVGAELLRLERAARALLD